MNRHGTGATERPRYKRGGPDREQNRLRRSLAEWRLALRIARRSVWRSRGTSLIVVIMVLLPVAGFSAAAVIGQSTFPTPQEKIAAELGQNEAKLYTDIGPNPHASQNRFDPHDINSPSLGSTPSTPLDEDGVRALFPAGTEMFVVRNSDVRAETSHGVASFPVTVGALWDDAFTGRTNIIEGRAPSTGSEVLVTSAALEHLGAHVGDSVTIVSPSQADLTITGVLRDAQNADAVERIYLPEGDFASTLSTRLDGYFLPNTVVDMGDLARLNHAGVTVLSRDILSHATSLELAGASSPFQPFGVLIAMAAVFAIFEIVLLAGAAFAVGARKQQRALATLASVGGSKRVMRRIVLSQGIVLGGIGGIVGVVIGVPTAAVVMAITSDGSATLYWGFHAQPLVLGAIIALAVIVGLTSAVIPARAAAKFDVLAALRGSRRAAAPSRAAPRFGLAFMILGIVSTIGSAISIRNLEWDAHPALTDVLLSAMIAGPLIAQIGAIMCGGLVLRTISRLTSHFSIGARLASRDSASNTRRSVPAFASVMVTAFLAITVICIGTVQTQQLTAQYVYSTLPGQATVFIPKNLDNSERVAVGDIEAIVAEDAPMASVARFYDPAIELDPNTGMPSDGVHVTASVPVAHLCPSNPLSPEYDAGVWESSSAAALEQQHLTATDARCSASAELVSHSWNQISVTTLAGLAIWLGGHVPDDVRKTFESGGVVSSAPMLINDGHLTLQWWAADEGPSGSSSELPSQQPLTETTMRAVSVKATYPLPHRVLMSTETAETLGISLAVGRLVASPGSEAFSQAQIDKLNGDLGALNSGVFVERGPDQTWRYIIAIVALLAGVLFVCASAVAIGLSRADGRADDATLSAVGATRLLRRSFSFWQAIILVGVGTLIGTTAGLLISYGLRVAGAFSSGPFTPPWLVLGFVAIGMPVAIAIGSWLVASKPTTLARRVAIG
ncbi:ABC-type transport system, involved in lipoprotein release, permease component [Paramicrobacterium humi]|uniref:ABC-type transport system, involved in lipoprotein release, permease component n=1 Tax=Paramicrobacterium humi TaxID=640635 RepID=A0A1H4JZ19_9MICO|nr:FtsX-like permease family protein [Microbacterium humi]SEB51423.1 ABC-type transport system, involved in lipoprotein release, permease component [Microbacterium humi]